MQEYNMVQFKKIKNKNENDISVERVKARAEPEGWMGPRGGVTRG